MDMASFGLAHQLGSLCGAPVHQLDGSQSQALSNAQAPAATALWKRPAAPRLRGRKPDMVSPPVSPRCSSPPSEEWLRRGQLRPDLSAACLAFDEAVATLVGEEVVASHAAPRGKGGEAGGRSGVPVFVMLPLDSVTPNHKVNRGKAMNASLMALKRAGVEGVMVDVWWGLVEGEEPGLYNWYGYAELLEMARHHGHKVQAVMSFHQCGGNVGDSCTIPLPTWVVEEIYRDQDLAYTDQWGRRNYEYVSLGCDELPVLKGRTPVQCYSDFMRAFRDTFSHLLGDTIVEIQVGMAPAGELRYPSYPELNGTWKFPGIGAFQCYDKYMVSSLRDAAEAIGKPEWGHGGPSDAGHYNNWPEDTPFFRKEGGWNSPYGEFFLSWYSQLLLNHGERILFSAEAILRGTGAKLSAKVAGIHWHYGTCSHAAELTAGYYNTRFRDGYVPIAKVLARHGVVFNFTCIEMDYEQPQEALCSPEGVVRQVVLATREVGVPLAGENALPRFDESAHDQIVRSSSLRSFAGEGKPGRGEESRGSMCAFTYLRMSPHLFQTDNWRRFVAFVKKMRGSPTGVGSRCSGKPSRSCRPPSPWSERPRVSTFIVEAGSVHWVSTWSCLVCLFLQHNVRL